MNNPALMELAEALAVSITDWRDEIGDNVRRDLLTQVAAIIAQLRTAAAEGGQMVPYDTARKLLGDACTSGMAGLGWGKQAEELFDAIVTDSGAGRDGSLALEVAYTEARVWKVEAMAARKVCDEWNKSAIAEGYGLGNTRACELLQAMDAARKAHEEKEAEDTAIAGGSGEG